MVVSGHREFDYEELLTATFALQGRRIASSRPAATRPCRCPAAPGRGPARPWPRSRPPPARRAEIGGKPERHLFDQARALIGGAERVAMVGDRIASDIEGGRRAGLATILVLSGATSRAEAAAADPPPDLVLDDLAALLR